MRTSTPIWATILVLNMLARSASAQIPASELTRTLTVPAPPEDDAPAPPIYVRKLMVTTLQFELLVRSVTISGPGAEHIAAQRLGEDAVVVRPAKNLPSWQRPTLEVTAEDGVRHVFTLVVDPDELDVVVRVQRGQCVTSETGDLDAAAAELLLREPVRTIRQLSFRQLYAWAQVDDVKMRVWGALPMSRLSVVSLSIESSGTPFLFDRAHLANAARRLKVLGARPDAEGNIQLVVSRPPGEADGTAYSLTVTEKGGLRQLIAENVVPWPAPQASTPSEPFTLEEGAKADPDGGTRSGKLSRTQVLERR
ncbi:DUF2381 family protein [Vitiosangium sp. GDMCC 1.1324]|uniref:DUF2381 family protein n=1 Tax=Vitiosangium sp. (strain GDMCC 1.1324) TaxID=2138576 RepID=UPI00130E92A4|nr:DUF2381 family protein [Vitiosangium sp. GDMCC 1.1324]